MIKVLSGWFRYWSLSVQLSSAGYILHNSSLKTSLVLFLGVDNLTSAGSSSSNCSPAGPSRAGSSRAGPSRAGSSRAGSSRAGSSCAGSSRARSSRGGSSNSAWSWSSSGAGRRGIGTSCYRDRCFLIAVTEVVVPCAHVFIRPR